MGPHVRTPQSLSESCLFPALTQALHGGVQSLGILAGIKVREVSNGTAVLGTLWTEKAEDEL